MAKGIHKMGEEETREVMADEVMILLVEEQQRQGKSFPIKMIRPSFMLF